MISVLRSPFVWLLAAGFLWGSEWVLTAPLQSFATPQQSTAWQLLLVGLLVVLCGVPPRGSEARAGATSGMALGLGLVGGPSVLIALAAQHGIGGWPLLLFSLQPLLFGLGAGRWSLPMTLAPAAVYVLLQGSTPLPWRLLPWLATALAGVALQAWALGIAKTRLRGLSPRAVRTSAAVACAIASVCMFATSLLLDAQPRLTWPLLWPSDAWLSAAGRIVVCGALPYWLFWKALASPALQPEQAATVQWVQTLVMVGESAASARAQLSLLTAVAFLGLAGCIAVVLWSRPEPPIALFGSYPGAAQQSELHSGQ